MAYLQIYRESRQLRLFPNFIQTQKRYPTSLGKIRLQLENDLSYEAKAFPVN